MAINATSEPDGSRGTGCCFLDSRVNSFTDYDCTSPATLREEIEIFYGDDLDELLQKAVGNDSVEFDWSNVTSICYDIQTINVHFEFSRVINSCQCYTNTAPVTRNDVAGGGGSGGNSNHTNPDVPVDNSKCSELDEKNCGTTEGCCYYTIFLNEFEIEEGVCVNLDAYVYYLIPNEVEALNRAGLNGTEDTKITLENFCRVLESDQTGGDLIEQCICHGQKKNFSGILGVSGTVTLLGLLIGLFLVLLA